MAKARRHAGLLVSCLVLFGATASAGAAPTVAQMLSFRPKQEGIEITTPSADEQAKCKVELVKTGRTSGWLLRDEKGEPLRRYLDTNGDNKIDVWSYYHKGVEVYREIDSNFNDKVDQYRWLNAAGSRWGLDPQEDGKVKTWKVISPEEVGQEVLQAVIKRDYARLHALLLTEAEIKLLELPAAEANRIRDTLRQAQPRFQQTVAKLGSLNDKVRWDHVELSAPQCVPADTTGMKQDLVRYASGIVYYQQIGEEFKGPIEAKGLQIGELIQVGAAWRLIDAPVPGSPLRDSAGTAGGDGIVMNKDLEAAYKELEQLDKAALDSNGSPAALKEWNLKRATVLEKMIALVAKMEPGQIKPEDRDNWVRQVADCLAAATQNSGAGDKGAHDRLKALRDKVVKEQPDTGLAGYLVYTEIMADYNVRINVKDANGGDVQKDLLEKLGKFVQDYPRADNVPDALEQLGMISELTGEEGPAKKWYEMFVKMYPTHPKVARMHGTKERLELKGKDFVLAGPTLSGSPFDVKTLKGKVVVVYYWASWNQQSGDDLAKLKTLQGTYGPKGLEIVCVNLDNTADEAKRFLAGKPAPAVHLFEQGGLSSKLGEQYGILVLPTMFLVGKDGKVLNHAEQMTTIEEAVKKALN